MEENFIMQNPGLSKNHQRSSKTVVSVLYVTDLETRYTYVKTVLDI